MDTLNIGDGTPGQASPVRTASNGWRDVGRRARMRVQLRSDRLYGLAIRSAQFGIGPDLAALSSATLWALHRLLRLVADGG